MQSNDFTDGVSSGMQSVVSMLQKNMISFKDTWNEYPEMKDGLQARYDEHRFIINQILDMKKGLTSTEE